MKALIVLLLCLAAGGSRASQEELPVHVYGGSGEQLTQDCSAIDHMTDGQAPIKDVPKIQFCIGYISGVVDFHSLATAGGHAAGLYCVSGQATITHLGKIVYQFGDTHPEKLHLPAVAFVSLALTDAFPCNK